MARFIRKVAVPGRERVAYAFHEAAANIPELCVYSHGKRFLRKHRDRLEQTRTSRGLVKLNLYGKQNADGNFARPPGETRLCFPLSSSLAIL